MRALLVKMSSLGDVVHALPAVTDAAAHGVTFDWVVEEGFECVPGRHPAVRGSLPIAWRRWRRSLRASAAEMRSFAARLRSAEYDLVIDAQGLLKSGAVTALARGRAKAGFDWPSSREGPSALFHGRRIAVPAGLHAVDRLRRLFAASFGYPLPDTRPAFGIETGTAAGKRCLLCHGSTWDSKRWPEVMWRALARRLSELGYEVLLPRGNPEEAGRAARIASGGNAAVLPDLSLAELTDELTRAALVVGVDSGLSHLAGALGVPTLVIYGSTDPALTGCLGVQARNLRSDFPCAPCRSRRCVYRGATATFDGEAVAPACYERVGPDRVLAALASL